jgi:hypothetical protein
LSFLLDHQAFSGKLNEPLIGQYYGMLVKAKSSLINKVKTATKRFLDGIFTE